MLCVRQVREIDKVACARMLARAFIDSYKEWRESNDDDVSTDEFRQLKELGKKYMTLIDVEKTRSREAIAAIHRCAFSHSVCVSSNALNRHAAEKASYSQLEARMTCVRWSSRPKTVSVNRSHRPTIYRFWCY